MLSTTGLRLFTLAVVVRLVLVGAAYVVTADPATFLTRDSALYLALGSALAHQGRFLGEFGPELFRLPGFPALIAVGVLAEHPILVTLVLHALLGGVTAIVTAHIADRLFADSRITLTCGLACALEPTLVVFTGRLLTETLFTTWIVLLVYALLRYLERPAPRWLLLSAVTVVGSAYVRPVAYFLPIWIAVLLVGLAWRRPDRALRIRHALVYLALTATALGAWQLRNGLATGYFGFSSQLDRSFFTRGASALAQQEGRAFEEFNRVIRSRHDSTTRDPALIRNGAYARVREEGLTMLLATPAVYARIHLEGMLRVLLEPNAVEGLRLFGLYPDSGGLLGTIADQGLLSTLWQLPWRLPLLFWTTVAFGLLLLPYLVLPVPAFLRRDTRRLPPVLLLGGLLLYFLLISGGPHATGRLRHPMMPLLVVLAGYEMRRWLPPSDSTARFSGVRLKNPCQRV